MTNSNFSWEAVSRYLLEKPGATQDFAFGPDGAVFKVRGKIFADVAWCETPLNVVLKCEPTEAIALRGAFPVITTARYFNKRHWNSVTLDGSMPDELVWRMIDDSYDLTVAGLPKWQREELREEIEQEISEAAPNHE